ncbi:signal peptidase II [Microbacterium sp. zg.B48]|uniref:signal peptidase II n=1 Tax=unclassified Microbacterium TaxID=2609290 RepID=UPI00214B9049|nr:MULTISPECIES: signal peptidase II [unclassified Microbacterium]MCR2763442.1 signal peptidase II [Microbacterium sp. zg.B48]MCR2809163.1 signal peptidase II [Microbacterium sp. zg.B185]WIM20315.1 signal peptidase II [Microbacterium sp. zg-B185]
MTGRAPLHKAAAGTIIAVLAVLVLAADQFSKYLAIQNLPPQQTVQVLGDFLSFYLVRNPGAAFSLGEGVTWIFTIALAVVAGVIVWLAATRVRSRLWAVVLGLLLGGVLGNLADRAFREPGFAVGHVVDFINTPWMWFWTNPAIYNVADIFIVTMMISVALLVLLGLHLDGTRDARRHAADSIPPRDGDDVVAGGGAVAVEGDQFPAGNPDAGIPRNREPRRDADG